jgi:hypothetical protein
MPQPADLPDQLQTYIDSRRVPVAAAQPPQSSQPPQS